MSNKGTASGYTMVELLVVMLVFGVVMTIITLSFARIVRNSGQLVKATETDIGGLVGLEVMRGDLEMGGYGLYCRFPDGKEEAITYTEARNDLVVVYNCREDCSRAVPFLFDDSTYGKDRYVPRAYRLGNDVSYNGSDYLVIKATSLGTSKASRRWGYVNYSSGTVSRPPNGDEEQQLEKGDRAVVIKSRVVGGVAVRELVTSSSDFSIKYNGPLSSPFKPWDRGESHLVYGVEDPDDEGLPLSFPFNRSDYYISRSTTRTAPLCALGTGVLYRSNITQTGWHALYPILDCVVDMQVNLYWDTNNDGEIDYRSDNVEEVAPTAAEFRQELKEIRVYILAQQGKKDNSYSYPVTDPERVFVLGDRRLEKIWSATRMSATVGAEWRNYHWKLYTIVVQPKNL